MGDTTTIPVSESTLQELEALRDDDEDYDDVLAELLQATDRGVDTAD